MKKLFLLLAILISFSLDSYSQTKHYKYLYSVDQNGVKRKSGYMNDRNFTIINNGATIYQSNAQGVNPWGDAAIYKFQGRENGVLKYRNSTIDNHWIIYLSPDYNRMNIYEYRPGPGGFGEVGFTHVFEAVDPNKIDTPSQFY